VASLPVLLGRRVGVARRAALTLAALMALLLLCVIAVFAGIEQRCGLTNDPDGPMSAEIPAAYVSMYAQSAAAFRVNRYLLAALHKQETDFGRSPLPGVTSGVNAAGCCAGPMQFNLHDTWSTYANAYRHGTRPDAPYPQRASSHPSVYDPFDAIMAAGQKLAADGANPSLASAGTRRAVLAYNHDDAYVTAVLAQAQRWERRAAQTNASSAPRASRLRWPTSDHTITSDFGPRSAPCAGCSTQHQGIDLGAPFGAPVRAAADGTVIRRANVSGYGNQVCLRHADALVTCYAHLSRFGVQGVGDDVRLGDVIGAVGATGSATAPHLHFETRRGTAADADADAIDPLPYLNGETSATDTPQEVAGCPLTDLSASGGTGGAMSWPLRGGILIGHSNAPGSTHDPVTWPGGWQSDNALDIATPIGTPVRAVADGRICGSCGFGANSSASPQLAGQRLTLTTADNAVYYAHLSHITVDPGETVRRGQIIGYSGSANGVAHLHVAVQHGRPEDLLRPPAAQPASSEARA
jgi:murein DD-endopeptidase MepM/ murein hydrolase activator NlpD